MYLLYLHQDLSAYTQTLLFSHGPHFHRLCSPPHAGRGTIFPLTPASVNPAPSPSSCQTLHLRPHQWCFQSSPGRVRHRLLHPRAKVSSTPLRSTSLSRHLHLCLHQWRLQYVVSPKSSTPSVVSVGRMFSPLSNFPFLPLLPNLVVLFIFVLSLIHI